MQKKHYRLFDLFNTADRAKSSTDKKTWKNTFSRLKDSAAAANQPH
jgi:hypothetical protein